ncbi:MAG TPA: DUF2505 family protein [Polyangiaceae bacterium]|nr:DUF2505 family protein [Polyangiaceae bacterium]
MKERRIEHTYDCSAEVFWDQLFLDDEYNRKLFVEDLHFSTWRVVRQEERGSELHRVIEATPPLGDLPAALKRLLSDGLGYEEHGVLDRKNQRYRLEVKPRSLASKLTIQGELSVQPISERSCRRLYVARVEARVLGVGGLLEQRLLDDIEKSYNRAAVFTNRWIAERLAPR